MAQLKPCPPSEIERMKRRRELTGEKQFVIHDTLMFEYEVCSVSAWTRRQRNDGFDHGRYEIVAATI